MHYYVCEVFYSSFSHKHVSTAIAVNYRVMFCNVWVCVCVGFVMSGCFGKICSCIYCVLYGLYCVFVSFLYVCLFLFVLSVVV